MLIVQVKCGSRLIIRDKAYTCKEVLEVSREEIKGQENKIKIIKEL